jgi:sugar lactone lactonase YvrE
MHPRHRLRERVLGLSPHVANLTFGGMLRNRLYMRGSTSLYACYVSTKGAGRA